MGTRTHFLLRAAAIAVLVVEAAYPTGVGTTSRPGAAVQPPAPPPPAIVAVR